MRVQKLYRDIVIIGAAMLLFVYVKGRFDLWQMEQKPYGVLIQSQSELTGAVVSEFPAIFAVFFNGGYVEIGGIFHGNRAEGDLSG